MPLPDDAPRPAFDCADHPFLVEYMFQNVDAEELRAVRTQGLSEASDIPPNEIHEFDFARAKQKEILALLSVFSRHLITREGTGHKWVLDKDTRETGRVAQTGYFWKGLGLYGDQLSTLEVPEILLVESDVYFNSFAATGDSLTLPDSLSALLSTYFDLEDDEREAFLAACVLFASSLEAWSISHSLTYVGLVSCIEALIDFEHRGTKREHCEGCGQPLYKVRQKFLDFANNYGSPDQEFRKIADRLYSRRSAIGHKGSLLAQDIAGRVTTPAYEGESFMELLYLAKMARLCLVNWLASCGNCGR
jgi:hypothetical protein